MNKKECIDACCELYSNTGKMNCGRPGCDWCEENGCVCDTKQRHEDAFETIQKLISEHFDNRLSKKVEKLNWLEKYMDKDVFDLIFSCEENVKEWHERMVYNNRKLHELFEEVEVLKSNTPLKFDELKKGMWVWDDVRKNYDQMKCVTIINSEKRPYKYIDFEHNGAIEFEENRFYKKQL